MQQYNTGCCLVSRLYNYSISQILFGKQALHKLCIPHVDLEVVSNSLNYYSSARWPALSWIKQVTWIGLNNLGLILFPIIFYLFLSNNKLYCHSIISLLALSCQCKIKRSKIIVPKTITLGSYIASLLSVVRLIFNRLLMNVIIWSEF